MGERTGRVKVKKTPMYRTLNKILYIVLLQPTVYGQKSVKFLALSSLTFWKTPLEKQGQIAILGGE